LGNKRIYLQENPDIRFDFNPETNETIMFVCGKPFVSKKLPLFSETFIRKHFKNEIEQHKDFVCPVEEPSEGETNS